MSMERNQSRSAAVKVSVIVITAVLYALATGITGFVPSPWGVGQLFIGGFMIGFMAVIAETLPVAIGAGLGRFIADMLFLAPAGLTNAPLSLVAGVPGNFIATLFFGWFVKKYKSWSSFVVASVSILTFGNLLTASLVVFFGGNLFGGVAFLLSKYYFLGLVFGFTVFWSVTTTPVTIIVVPLLVRAIAPLQGRSAIIVNVPTWSRLGSKVALIATFIVSLALFLVALLYSPDGYGLASFPGLVVQLYLGLIGIVVIAPIVGIVIGSKLRATKTSG